MEQHEAYLYMSKVKDEKYYDVANKAIIILRIALFWSFSSNLQKITLRWNCF